MPSTLIRGHPATAEVQYTDEEREFLLAVQAYKRAGRQFPTCREVLAILLSLGYRKVEAAGPLPVHGRRKGGA